MADNDNLVAFVTTGVSNIYTRLAKMYDFEIKATGEIDRVVPTLAVKDCPTDLLNRAAWLWLRETFQELQQQVNAVVALYNYAGYVDLDSYDDTPPIQLAIQESLIIDMSVLDSEFKRVNDLLDKLDQYALLVEKGG